MEWKDARRILFEREKRTTDCVNSAESGYYDRTEILNGQQFFTSSDPQNPKMAYRKVVDFGVLPNTGLKSVPHGITGIVSLTRLYGAATDPTGAYIPLPYASGSAIELYADNTNINVITTSNRTNFTTCYVVIEYLKN